MNYIWPIMILVSLFIAFATGKADETMTSAFDGAKNSVTTMLTLAPLMCFWSGIMNVAQKSGIINAIKKLLSPIIDRLFKNEDERAKGFITMNICANMLGMGNAATPMGIEAMRALSKTNPLSDRPSKAMCLFMVLNTTCFTFVPSTVLSLRSAAGSVSPASVMPFIWTVSAFSVVFAVFLVKIFIKE